MNAEEIVKFRTKNKLTQEQLSYAVECSSNYIQRLESGKAKANQLFIDRVENLTDDDIQDARSKKRINYESDYDGKYYQGFPREVNELLNLNTLKIRKLKKRDNDE